MSYMFSKAQFPFSVVPTWKRVPWSIIRDDSTLNSWSSIRTDILCSVMDVVTLVICENRERFAIEEDMEFSTRGSRS